MVGEDRRAVGRAQARGVEEVLDAEVDTVVRLRDLADEGV
jgi:hypothetical protein